MGFATRTSVDAGDDRSWQPFPDRRAAGELLAERLEPIAGPAEVIVLGLPRGGLPVAQAIASPLGLPLDVFVVRKLGVPGHEELAFGALASGGTRVLNDEVIAQARLTEPVIDQVSRRESAELEKREQLYRGGRPAPALDGRTVILVDDGLATGSTMRAAVGAVRTARAAKIVIAVPVAPADTCAELRYEADDVVCLRTPEPFYAVGMWYEDFSPVSDDEVRRILAG